LVLLGRGPTPLVKMEEDIDWERNYAEDMEAFAMMEKQDEHISRRRLSFESCPKEIVIDYQPPVQTKSTSLSISRMKRKYEETEEREIAKSHKEKEIELAKRRKVVKLLAVKPLAATNKQTAPKKSYSTRPLSTPCIPVNSYNGRRVYVPLHESEAARVGPLAECEQLLSTPISVLREKIDQIEFAEARQAAGLDEHETLSHRTEEFGNIESQLWVDKYAPSSFTELLSDERVNREVLYWLKEWDECVFNKKSIVKSKTASPSPWRGRGRGQGGRGTGGRWNGQRGWGTGSNGSPAPKSSKSSEQIPDVLREKNMENDSRPNAKVILLAGPPGLGKTTLAHVIARHAGYNPVEINASDDRSANIFMSKVLNATQMQAVFSVKKPNCLILDEIDGLTGGEKGAIKELLKVINAKDKKRKQSQTEEEGKGKGSLESKGRKKGASSAADLNASLAPSGKLRRPIICICNDPYVPALRDLRSIARVFRFEKADVSRLTSRLLEICNKEGLRADQQTLMALVQLADHDIRSCLNTLQFIRRKGRTLTADMLTSSAVGHKDVLKSLFDVWREIFQKSSSVKHKALQNLIHKQRASQQEPRDALGYELSGPAQLNDSSSLTNIQSHFDSFYSSLADHGEIDRIIDGCFENYLKLAANDPCLAKTNDCLRWLELTDEMSALIQKEQHFTFCKYMPITPLVFHRHCSNHPNPFISFPQGGFQMNQKLSTYKNMVQSFIINSPPNIRGTLNCDLVVMELVPYLLDIISPKLRRLNSALYSEEEKAHLHNVVSIMSCFKLTYKPTTDQPTKPHSGSSSRLRLEPPLDELVRLEGLQYDSRHITLDDTQKELIATEITNEAIKKAASVALVKIKGDSSQPPDTIKPIDDVKKKEIKDRLVKNTQRLVSEEIVHRDFFGRVISSPQKEPSTVKSPHKSATGEMQEMSIAESTPSRTAEVFYKFHEGFTNAVRRPAFIKDFL